MTSIQPSSNTISSAPSMGDISAGDSRATAQQSLSVWLDSNSALLPMLPGVATQVMELAGREDSSHQELADLIQSDQALASWIMRVSNSAAYNMGTALVTLQQAITRLGMDMVTDIAISATTQMELFKSEQHQSILDQQALEALTQGLWAKEIARQIRGNVESAFLCGLLQSIGKPLVLLALNEIMGRTAITLTDSQIRKLQTEFDFEYGVAISKQWELPEVICDCIQFAKVSHKATRHSSMVKIVNAAAHFMRVNLYPDDYPADELLQRNSIIGLNLYEDDVDTLLGKSDSIKDKTAALKIH